MEKLTQGKMHRILAGKRLTKALNNYCKENKTNVSELTRNLWMKIVKLKEEKPSSPHTKS